MSYQVLPEIFLPQLVKNLVLLFGQAGLGKAQVFVQVDPDAIKMIIYVQRTSGDVGYALTYDLNYPESHL